MRKVSLLAQTLSYVEGGGHLWVYLNWALGLRAIGCEVTWVESIDPKSRPDQIAGQVAHLRAVLQPYGFADAIALLSLRPGDIPAEFASLELTANHAREADLFINFRYGLPQDILDRFRRTALVDIDPGLLQLWVQRGQLVLPRHDFYFSTGEGVGRPGGRVPSLGLQWHSILPCVAVELWPVAPAGPDAAYTTISHWQAEEYVVEDDGTWYTNTKRAGFLPFLDLPKLVPTPLELALCMEETDPEAVMLRERGWRLRHSHRVAGTPQDYHRYIQNSYGEFSAAKPSCVKFSIAWMSDRTLCYLASGKPAVVQYTGESALLPDAAGLWRFKTLDEAARAVRAVAEDYPNQCRLARKLAEEVFDARRIAARVLEITLDRA